MSRFNVFRIIDLYGKRGKDRSKEIIRALVLLMVLVCAVLFACNKGGSDEKALISPAPQPEVMKENTARSSLARDSNPQVPDADMQALVKGLNSFAFEIERQLRTDYPGNIFFSPLSITQALDMALAGAQGATAEQMMQALQIDLPQARLHAAANKLLLGLNKLATGSQNQDDAVFKLVIANALWQQNGYAIKSDFLDTLALNYGAGLNLADFKKDYEASRAMINQWVSDQTAQRIKDLFPQGSIDRDTRLVLANAIYFKADWAKAFEKSATANAPFYPSPDKAVTVPMMVQEEALPYYRGGNFQAVELAYKQAQASMVILLPDDSENIDDFIKNLTPSMWNTLTQSLQTTQVRLHLPRFGYDGESIDLNGILSRMGMRDAFDPDRADFSGITESDKLVIQSIVHKAFLKVDETGTEAAAATGISFRTTSYSPPQIDVAVNRPFVFGIRDRASGAILFLGVIMDASK